MLVPFLPRCQAADRRKEVEVLKKRTAVEEVEMKQRRVQVEDELREVQPLIDSARKAVGNIKKDNIAEIRSLKMPPDAIRDVLEGVLMVLGQQDTSWNNMKTFLGKGSVKDDIINYDAHKITPEIRARVRRCGGAAAKRRGAWLSRSGRRSVPARLHIPPSPRAPLRPPPPGPPPDSARSCWRPRATRSRTRSSGACPWRRRPWRSGSRRTWSSARSC
jgi:hypothetical protein